MNNHQANDEVLPGEEAPQQDSYVYPDQTPRQLSGAVKFNFSGLGIVGLIFAGFFVICTHVMLDSARLNDAYANAESKRSEHTQGVVTSAERYGDERMVERSVLIYHFDFDGRDGAQLSGDSFSESLVDDWHKPHKRSAEYIGGTRFEFEVGQPVEVHYDPADPQGSAVIKGQRKGVKGTEVSMIIPIGFALFFLVFLAASISAYRQLGTLRDGLRVQAGLHDGRLYIYYQGQVCSAELNKQQIKLMGDGPTYDIFLSPHYPRKLEKALILTHKRTRLSIAEDGTIDARISICNILQYLALITSAVMFLLYAIE